MIAIIHKLISLKLLDRLVYSLQRRIPALHALTPLSTAPFVPSILDCISPLTKEEGADQTTDNDASKYTTDNPTNSGRFGKTRRASNGLRN